MKIAIFHNVLSGGAKRALYSFVKYLKDLGNQVDVHVPSTADENYLTLKGIVDRFHVYPVRRTMTRVISSSFQYFLPTYASSLLVDLKRAQGRIAEEINVGPYDVVFSEQDQFTLTPSLLRRLKKPTVYYCQQPARAQESVLEEVVRAASQMTPVAAYKRIWRAYLKSRLPKIDAVSATDSPWVLGKSAPSDSGCPGVGPHSGFSLVRIQTTQALPPKQNPTSHRDTPSTHQGFLVCWQTSRQHSSLRVNLKRDAQ